MPLNGFLKFYHCVLPTVDVQFCKWSWNEFEKEKKIIISSRTEILCSMGVYRHGPNVTGIYLVYDWVFSEGDDAMLNYVGDCKHVVHNYLLELVLTSNDYTSWPNNHMVWGFFNSVNFNCEFLFFPVMNWHQFKNAKNLGLWWEMWMDDVQNAPILVSRITPNFECLHVLVIRSLEHCIWFKGKNLFRVSFLNY